MSLFEVCIMSPDEILLDSKEVKELVLPTTTGRMGVLSNHSPLVTGLEIGVMLISTAKSSNWTTVALLGGFALIKNNKVTVVVSGAQLGSNINIDEAEKNFSEAKAKLEKATDRKEKIESTLNLKRTRATYEACQQQIT
jgi:ATP synthase F1 epsilon subunit